MILQAWLTLPSCLASSSPPSLGRIIFWVWFIGTLRFVSSTSVLALRSAPPPYAPAHQPVRVPPIKPQLSGSIESFTPQRHQPPLPSQAQRPRHLHPNGVLQRPPPPSQTAGLPQHQRLLVAARRHRQGCANALRE